MTTDDTTFRQLGDECCALRKENRRLRAELDLERERVGIAVTDDMALAFHHALTDGAIGEADMEEIKIGLRAALVNHKSSASADADKLRAEVAALKARTAVVDVIVAWGHGARIDYRIKGSEKWHPCHDPAWLLDKYDYRIAPISDSYGDPT